MKFFELFEKEILSLVFALLLALILYIFRARTKLHWAIPHGFTFLIHNPTPAPPAPEETGGTAPPPAPVAQSFNIYTGSIIVSNAGKNPATGVEVTFNWKPDNYNIWPVRPYQSQVSPDDRYTLKFDNLAPDEHFVVEMISSRQLPAVMSVRCKECVGKQINMSPSVVYPKWMSIAVGILLVLGTASIFYLAAKVVSIFL